MKMLETEWASAINAAAVEVQTLNRKVRAAKVKEAALAEAYRDAVQAHEDLKDQLHRAYARLADSAQADCERQP